MAILTVFFRKLLSNR